MKLKSSEGECTKIGRFGIKADADRSDDVSAASRRSQLLSRESFRANSSLRERSGNMPIDPRVPPDPSQCVAMSARLMPLRSEIGFATPELLEELLSQQDMPCTPQRRR